MCKIIPKSIFCGMSQRWATLFWGMGAECRCPVFLGRAVTGGGRQCHYRTTQYRESISSFFAPKEDGR